jgi:hypothetical protein
MLFLIMNISLLREAIQWQIAPLHYVVFEHFIAAKTLCFYTELKVRQRPHKYKFIGFMVSQFNPPEVRICATTIHCGIRLSS